MTELDSRPERAGPIRILPDESVLELEHYLDMQAALADETQFRLLYELTDEGSADSSELAELLDVDEDRVQSGLEELVAVGLAQNWIRNEPETDGVYSYYRASSLGEGLLEDGIGELLDGEWDALDRYS
jgi:predicted transcriptional regulator